RDGRTGRATGGHQAQLADREAPFAQDLDHRPTDDAGGADDRDGEGSGGHAGQGSTTIFIHSGHGGSIAARRRSPAGAHWSLSSRTGTPSGGRQTGSLAR